jgi:ribosomal protein S18 acetylase RimI-like enzyme
MRTTRRRRARSKRQKGGQTPPPYYHIAWHNSIPARYIEAMNAQLRVEFLDVQPDEIVVASNCGVIAELITGETRELAAFTIINKKKGKCWYIHWLCTQEAHRQKGLASAMIELLKKQPAACLFLHVMPDSVASKIYLKAGFSKTGRLRVLKDENGNDVGMEEMEFSINK